MSADLEAALLSNATALRELMARVADSGAELQASVLDTYITAQVFAPDFLPFLSRDRDWKTLIMPTMPFDACFDEARQDAFNFSCSPWRDGTRRNALCATWRNSLTSAKFRTQSN